MSTSFTEGILGFLLTFMVDFVLLDGLNTTEIGDEEAVGQIQNVKIRSYDSFFEVFDWMFECGYIEMIGYSDRRELLSFFPAGCMISKRFEREEASFE